MARTSTPAPAGRPGQDEDREQRIAALRIRLHETAGQIRSAAGLDQVPAGSRPPARRDMGERPADLPPGYRTRPWSGDTRPGGQPDARSTAMKKASRSSPARAAGRNQTAAALKTQTRTIAGVTPGVSPTSGTCPRPPASPSRSRPPSPRRPGRRRPACGTACAGSPAGKASRSNGRTAAPVTAPRSGPPGASASRPACPADRPPGR